MNWLALGEDIWTTNEFRKPSFQERGFRNILFAKMPFIIQKDEGFNHSPRWRTVWYPVVSSRISLKNYGNINDYVCNKCSVYEFQLKEALDELGSARMIIDILPKELLTSTTTLNTQHNNLALTEGLVNSNPRRKKKKSLTCENGTLLMLQQFQPIPVATNRYALLVNLQEVMETSHKHDKTSEGASAKNLKKSLLKIKKKKIVIIGDSHARGYAVEISSVLGNDFEVTGTVINGARLENIKNLADSEISTLGKSGTVIVIGGANNINKNETITGLTQQKNL